MDLLFLPINKIISDSINKINAVESLNQEEKTIISIEETKQCKNKNYIRKFIEKNKDKLKEKQICPVCYSTYTYFNKSKHIRTKRHLTLLEVQNKN